MKLYIMKRDALETLKANLPAVYGKYYTEKSNKWIYDICGEEPFIEFKDVKKIYRMGEVDIKALDGVNFTIEKGEFVVIAGASGAGKSTILNILGGMDSATSGDVIVDGDYVSKYNSRQLTTYRRYDIGFVFQFYNLVQNLTVTENVELAAQICRDPLNIGETVAAVGLADRRNNFPAQLSGGEQQRVAIARALAKNPKLLLCDEPTGALDSKTSKDILILLEKINQQYGTTMLIVTHNNAIRDMVHKVIIIRDGQISEEYENETRVPAKLLEDL